MREREQFLRAFHDARPGITSRALARAGSYERLAATVPEGHVLDLACGDGALMALLGPRAIGLDLSRGELRRARARSVNVVTSTSTSPSPSTSPTTPTTTPTTTTTTSTSSGSYSCSCSYSSSDDMRLVQARAQELPFRDRSFDAATCHLAFMLFDQPEAVVAELHRILKPGAPFIALLGGGPTADGRDAFHHFASLLPTSAPIGHHRTWEDLFAGWRDVSVERWPLDLSGTFDEVWAFLGASYQLRAGDTDRIRDELRAAFPGERVPCTVVTYCATATR